MRSLVAFLLFMTLLALVLLIPERISRTTVVGFETDTDGQSVPYLAFQADTVGTGFAEAAVPHVIVEERGRIIGAGLPSRRSSNRPGRLISPIQERYVIRVQIQYVGGGSVLWTWTHPGDQFYDLDRLVKAAVERPANSIRPFDQPSVQQRVVADFMLQGAIDTLRANSQDDLADAIQQQRFEYHSINRSGIGVLAGLWVGLLGTLIILNRLRSVDRS